MKTAEEFLVRDELFKTPLTEEEKHYYIDRIITYDDYIKAMIEFAKMHVQEALKQACEKAELEDIDKPEDFFEYDGVNGFSKILNKNVVSYEGYYHVCINDQSVLNAYPLENII